MITGDVLSGSLSKLTTSEILSNQQSTDQHDRWRKKTTESDREETIVNSHSTVGNDALIILHAIPNQLMERDDQPEKNNPSNHSPSQTSVDQTLKGQIGRCVNVAIDARRCHEPAIHHRSALLEIISSLAKSRDGVIRIGMIERVDR